jgi:hypothetical protein
LPAGTEPNVVHEPSQLTGGSKLVLTPPPGFAQGAELIVHVAGNEHAPTGGSHEHAGHAGAASGASWPSNTISGAFSGHAGKST